MVRHAQLVGVQEHIGVPQPGTSSHSLGEPSGSNDFLQEIFCMRTTLHCPMQRLDCTCKNKQRLFLQLKDTFVLFSFSKAFSRYM